MILVTKCTQVTLGRPAERPQVQSGSSWVQLAPGTKRPSLNCGLFSPALSYAPRRESLLRTHVPSPPQEAGGLNLTLSLCAQRAPAGEPHARVRAGPPDRRVRDTEVRARRLPAPGRLPLLPPAPPRPPGWGWWWFASRAGEKLPQESRGTAAAQRGAGSSRCNRSRGTWPVAAPARGNARKSAVAATQRHARAAGCCWWAAVTIRNYKPGGYTRHARCSRPGKEEGSGAPGHAETGGGGAQEGRRNIPPQPRGCPRGAVGDSSGLVPAHPAHPARPASSPPSPGARGCREGGGGGGLGRRPGAVPVGRADPARGAHLAGARPAARLLHACGGHGVAAPRAPRLAPTARVWSFRGTLAGSLSLLEASLPRHVPRPAGAWVLAPLPRCGAPTLSPLSAPLTTPLPARPLLPLEGSRVSLELPNLVLLETRGLGTQLSPHRAHLSPLSSGVSTLEKDQICLIPQFKFVYVIILKRF